MNKLEDVVAKVNPSTKSDARYVVQKYIGNRDFEIKHATNDERNRPTDTVDFSDTRRPSASTRLIENNSFISARTAVPDSPHEIRHKTVVHRDVFSAVDSLDV